MLLALNQVKDGTCTRCYAWVPFLLLSFLSSFLLEAQMVKSLPAVWETRVWSLDGEDPLEKEMATHFSILAWKIPWMEEPGGLQSMGSQRVGHGWAASLSFHGTAVKQLLIFTVGFENPVRKTLVPHTFQEGWQALDPELASVVSFSIPEGTVHAERC